MIKAINPDVKIGFIGAKVAVEPEKSLIAARAVDFVARNEFDFTIKEVADGHPVEPTSRDFPTATARASSSTTRTARFSRTWMRFPG